jgi:RecB family exonuclease
MTFQIHRTPFEEDLLAHLASDLNQTVPGSAQGDFSRALVVLPSSRACQTLGHLLLETHHSNTIVLPKTITMTQLIEELGLAVGISTGNLPDDLVRPLVLAHQLKGESWLKDRPESAPGLAEEFVSLFDEVRLHGCTVEILEDGPFEDLAPLVHTEAAADLEADLVRIRRVWQLYRKCLGRDKVDALCEVAQMLTDFPGKEAFECDLLLVAGFANMDPVRAALLRALGQWPTDSRLYLPETKKPLSRFFADTWSSAASGGGLDPLSPSRLVEKLILPEAETEPVEETILTLREKVTLLGSEGGLIQPEGPLKLLACGTSEDESRVVANRVVEILQKPGGNRETTAVVTNDPVLAARVVAQLRDAGIDSDQTLGAPLSSLPAGLLLRFLLRTVLTDFRSDSLLEVLTHPYVKLTMADGKSEKWNLRLEKMLRRHDGGQPGASGLVKLAGARDEAASRLFEKDSLGMSTFVDLLLKAFEPLRQQAGKSAGQWSDLLPAVIAVWNNLCPDEPFEENKEKSDITAAVRLVGRLADSAEILPPVRLKDLSSDLSRLLAAESVAPHRGKAKPILVTGTVEARLEKFDNLILAGMAEGKFPARSRRPLFLNSRVRRFLGLPDWRHSASRDAALFLRLLFNAPKVLVTWPTEEDGRLVLPSPFVARLALALPGQEDPSRAGAVPLWRKTLETTAEILSAQKAFKEETHKPTATEKIRPLNRLSWSALRSWRECPYRHLLARGYVLQKEDEVREEFGRREYGSLVHQTLCNFLEPGSEGYNAVLGGHDQKAREVLNACAHAEFLERGDDTAAHRLWLGNFLKCVSTVVAYEISRFKDWRPVLLEKHFQLALADLLAWLHQERKAANLDLDIPKAPETDEPIVLRGIIDRVDEKVTDADPGRRLAAIIDYKTGKLPSAKDVQQFKDLQILLYAVALEMGAVEDSDSHSWLTSEGFYYEISEASSGPPKKIHLPCGDAAGRGILVDGALELAKMALAAADEDQAFGLIPSELAQEGEKELPCRYCEFRGVCRLEDRKIPEPTVLKVDKMVNRKEGAW